MKTIEFNHNYTKLHNQKWGYLLSAKEVLLDDKFTEEAYLYDTDGKFPLERGKTYLQLVFIGDKWIPFTTYRKVTEANVNKYCCGAWQVFEFKVTENN